MPAGSVGPGDTIGVVELGKFDGTPRWPRTFIGCLVRNMHKDVRKRQTTHGGEGNESSIFVGALERSCQVRAASRPHVGMVPVAVTGVGRTGQPGQGWRAKNAAEEKITSKANGGRIVMYTGMYLSEAP